MLQKSQRLENARVTFHWMRNNKILSLQDVAGRREYCIPIEPIQRPVETSTGHIPSGKRKSLTKATQNTAKQNPRRILITMHYLVKTSNVPQCPLLSQRNISAASAIWEDWELLFQASSLFDLLKFSLGHSSAEE